MGWGATQKTTQQQSSNQTQTQTPTEPGYISQFREGMIPSLQKMMSLSQAPIYGDAAKADYLGNLNDLANQSIKHLSSTLAGRGQLDSGAFGAAASGIEQNRLSQAGGFFANLPGMERSAQLQNLGAALGIGMNFTGRAPTGMNSTGDSSSNGSSSSYSNPGLSGLVSALGGMGLSALMGPGGGGFMSSMFGQKPMSPQSMPFSMSSTAQNVMGQGSMFPGWGGG